MNSFGQRRASPVDLEFLGENTGIGNFRSRPGPRNTCLEALKIPWNQLFECGDIYARSLVKVEAQNGSLPSQSIDLGAHRRRRAMQQKCDEAVGSAHERPALREVCGQDALTT